MVQIINWVVVDVENHVENGANYLNYETMAPNVAGSLSKPTPPAGYVPLGTQPESISGLPFRREIGICFLKYILTVCKSCCRIPLQKDWY